MQKFGRARESKTRSFLWSCAIHPWADLLNECVIHSNCIDDVPWKQNEWRLPNKVWLKAVLYPPFIPNAALVLLHYFPLVKNGRGWPELFSSVCILSSPLVSLTLRLEWGQVSQIQQLGLETPEPLWIRSDRTGTILYRSRRMSTSVHTINDSVGFCALSGVRWHEEDHKLSKKRKACMSSDESHLGVSFVHRGNPAMYHCT